MERQMKFHETPGLGRALYTMKQCATEIMMYELYKHPKASMCVFHEFGEKGIHFHLYKRWGRDDREFIKEAILDYQCLAPYAEDEDLYDPEYQYTGPTEEMKAAKVAHDEAERAKLAHDIAEQNKKIRAEEYARFLALKSEVERLSEKFEGA
jgi:hypothetical protein